MSELPEKRPRTAQETAETLSGPDAPSKRVTRRKRGSSSCVLDAPAICSRIEAALDRFRVEAMEVRAIYLDDDDRDELRREVSAYWRRKLGGDDTFYPSSFIDEEGKAYLLVSAAQVPLELREGGRSVVYSTHGVGVQVPKKLSAKVRRNG